MSRGGDKNRDIKLRGQFITAFGDAWAKSNQRAAQ